MSIFNREGLCERLSVNAARQLGGMFPDYQRRTSRTRPSGPMNLRAAWLAVALFAAAAFGAPAQNPNPPAATNQIASSNAPAPVESAKPPPVAAAASRSGGPASKLDEASFAIIPERNIFNANRSGGRVTVASSRRQPRIETFTLVGTMAYEKGVFAFFEGSSSEFTKAVKAEGVIAGHKLAEIYAGSVRLEADGKQIELPIGSQMRREDAGTWLMREAVGSSGGSESASPVSRSGSGPSASPSAAPANQSEILKRLMERREKE